VTIASTTLTRIAKEMDTEYEYLATYRRRRGMPPVIGKEKAQLEGRMAMLAEWAAILRIEASKLE
jgi:hypothetical protein